MRRLLASAVIVASVLASGNAAATDVQACLGASEKGQQARSAGRLREARELFLVCGADVCPAMVRRDCTQWQADLVSVMPSIVFGAKDRQGRDLFDVTVSMDGEPIVKKLDGKSVLVDPGPHSFKFEVAGQPPIVERALVKEGERTRVITVTFGDGGGATGAAGGSRVDSSDSGRDRDRDEGAGRGGHTVLPWIVFGAGMAAVVAGAIVIVSAPGRPSNCNPGTNKCTKAPGETDAQLASEQDQAGAHDGRPILGLVIGGIGLAVASAGLLWHFFEPTGSERKSSLHVSPWAGPGGSGVTVGGSF